ncbi:D-isomer specific 2-hydroxyacid dehydrogenase family protein [Streptomyces sp. AP-93]|uniref:NAD(P)-dependent oxidoreductase n=1 Tax=Streptomyces sp. AP-93 TaxID=2929048 RepID=UPI001FAF110C|nr:NAD(P)-dependent oxidoreductase [Streptomyces sp. AP-93]MCJ0875373.1 hypothetical protein [Streptomyces sp. AP-93]
MTAGVLVLGGAMDAASLRTAVSEVGLLEAEEVPSACASDSVSILILRSGVRLGESELRRLPRLRHVVRCGSGTDHIDLEALARRGIGLHRNASASAPAVAEWALAAALALTRRMPLGHNALLAGVHDKHACMSVPLADMTIGIWGAGPVGLAVGRALAPHASSVSYSWWPSNPLDVTELSAEALMERAAIHVVALPLRASTREFIGLKFLRRTENIRPHVICVGRVETLDLPACMAALAEGRLSGLAVDAIEREHVDELQGITEPMNLLVSPHIGAQRSDVRAGLDSWAVELVRRLVTDEQPAFPEGGTG